MKTKVFSSFLAWITIFCVQGKALAQGSFQNLDFEAASVSGYAPGADIPIALAVPGWTCSYYNAATSETYTGFSNIWYDGVSLGGYAISVNDSDLYPGYLPLQGSYDVTLMGGNGVTAIIGQAGTIPTDAVTLFVRYTATVVPLVSINGQPINMVALGGDQYAGNISAYSGQFGALSFTAPAGAPSFFTFDDIVFSPTTIPEPGAFSMLAIGLFSLDWYRRRCQLDRG